MRFTSDSQTIVVSDKFGDIFRYLFLTYAQSSIDSSASYPLNYDPTSLPPNKPKGPDNPEIPKDSIISHPSMSGGTLVLGHTSLLTTFVLSPDEQYIITADRDEHIRVSWYPQGYNIESYCLGSVEYVTVPLRANTVY